MKVSNMSRKKKKKVVMKEQSLLSKVYCIQNNVEEYSWSSRALCAKHIMLEYQTCFLGELLPVQEILPTVSHRQNKDSYTFHHVTATQITSPSMYLQTSRGNEKFSPN